jgi:hypothetical protein
MPSGKNFSRELSIRRRLFVEGVPATTPASNSTIRTTQRRTTMTQYLLSVWHDEEYTVDFSGDEIQRIVGQVDAFNAEVQAAGAWVFAGGLHPASSATVVRSTDGEVSMTDGPFAESKEQMGGFWVIEAADLDAALEWARKGAAACEGPVEVRPFQDG